MPPRRTIGLVVSLGKGGDDQISAISEKNQRSVAQADNYVVAKADNASRNVPTATTFIAPA